MRGTVPMINGKPRRSLTEEIDRLESILDGLADALNGAIADAVRDAVGAAARDALANAAPPVPSHRAATANAGRAQQALHWAAGVVARAAGWLAMLAWLVADVVRRSPRTGVAAAGLGLATFAVAWAGPSGLAAVAAGAAVAVLVAVADHAREPRGAHSSDVDPAEQLGHRNAEGSGQAFDVDQ